MRTDIAEKLISPSSPWNATDWRLPFALALAVHILGLLLILLSPYFHSTSKIIDVQTVNLFTATEIEPAPAPKKAAKPAAARPQKTRSEPRVTVPPKAPAATAPPVTLRPLKSKNKSAEDDLKAKQTLLERKLRQVQASVEKKKAEEAVRQEVDTALERIRQAYAGASQETAATSVPAVPTRATNPTKATAGRGGSGAVEVSEAKKRYYAAIQMHLSRYWTLPENHNWKESLEVIAVLWFRPDGTIVKRAFEKKSENEFFNRFVQLTLEKVDKVPPIPLDLPSNEAEQIIDDGIGFRFHPSGIY